MRTLYLLLSALAVHAWLGLVIIFVIATKDLRLGEDSLRNGWVLGLNLLLIAFVTWGTVHVLRKYLALRKEANV